MKQRAAARQTDLLDLLVSILRPDAQGLRTRINASFDEWTDRNKRAWVTLNITFCDKNGVMQKRVAQVTAIVAKGPDS